MKNTLLFFLPVFFFLHCNSKTPPHPKAPLSISGQLRNFLQKRSSQERDPSILLHLIAALGPNTTIQGQKIPLFFASRYLEKKRVGQKEYYHFPHRQKDGVVEAHTDQFLKVCQDSGFSGNVTPSLTMAQLAKDSRALFRLEPQKLQGDLAWSLLVFCREGKREWTNAWGEKIFLKDGAELALQWLEDLTEPIKKAMAKGKFFKKSKIHRWYCAGFHLFQGVLASSKAGLYTEEEQKEVAQQIAIHFYRLQKEPGMYWAEIQKKKTKNMKLSLYLNLLKFYGHFFEVMAYGRNGKIWTPTKEEEKLIQKNLKILKKVIQWLFEKEIYQKIDQYGKKWGPRFYRDLINDSCHALRGLEAWQKEKK